MKDKTKLGFKIVLAAKIAEMHKHSLNLILLTLINGTISRVVISAIGINGKEVGLCHVLALPWPKYINLLKNGIYMGDITNIANASHQTIVGLIRWCWKILINT